jgi:hypothetical protein
VLNGGGCPSSRVCACVCEGESVSVSKLKTIPRGDVDLRSTNDVEVLIIAGSVEDARVVEYVPVSVSKLERLLRGHIDLHSTNEEEDQHFP